MLCLKIGLVLALKSRLSFCSKEHLPGRVLFVTGTTLLYVMGESVLVLMHCIFIQLIKNLISVFQML